MSRIILAVAVVGALAACGGKEHRARAGSTARSSHSEAARSNTTQPTQQKKKTTKPDTTRAKNPLTNR
jgi:hypothetical protein